MRNKILAIIILATLLIPAASSLVEQKIIKTDVTVKFDDCVITLDTEDDDGDRTITIPSPSCNNTQPYLYETTVSLAFLRNISVGEVDIVNLTTRCVDFFSQTDYITNFTACREAKGRLEENYQEISNKLAAADGNATVKTAELSTCTTDLSSSKSNLDECLVLEKDASVLKNKYASDRLTFSLLALLIGIGGHIWWTKRAQTGRQSFPKQEKAVANIRIDDDIPSE